MESGRKTQTTGKRIRPSPDLTNRRGSRKHLVDPPSPKTRTIGTQTTDVVSSNCQTDDNVLKTNLNVPQFTIPYLPGQPNPWQPWFTDPLRAPPCYIPQPVPQPWVYPRQVFPVATQPQALPGWVQPNPYQILQDPIMSLHENASSTIPRPDLAKATTEPESKPKKKRSKKKKPSQTVNPEVERINLKAMGQQTMGYYLPGTIGPTKVLCLVDSGCSITVLSKKVFDTLPKTLKATLEEKRGLATVADGSSTSTYGRVTLKGKLRHFSYQHQFLVADVQEDVLIGLDFLQHYQASLCFKNAELSIGGSRLSCVDEKNLPLSSKVYAVRRMSIPAGSEAIIEGRLSQNLPGEHAIVECLGENSWLVGSAMVTLDNGRFPVRILNSSPVPLEIPSGKLVARAHPATELRQTAHCTKVDLRSTKLVDNKIPEHVADLYSHAVGTCTTPSEKERLKWLLCRYAKCFSTGSGDVGRTSEVKHSIPIQPGAAPIKQRPRRHGPVKEAIIEDQVQEMATHGFIEPSSSAWSSPVVLVKKKDGSWRFCIDYRKLNAVTVKDAYPLPRIDESLDALSGSKFFSTLDLVSGYWQVELDEDAKQKSAFCTRNGLWQWRVLPFGLTSAPSTFERLMEKVLRGLHWKSVLIYLDDIVVFSNTISQHLDRLEEVLQRLEAANLKLKPTKCELFKKEVKYLGHVVSAEGVKTDPDKIKAIREWPTPTCTSELRAFLGTGSYYRRFVKGFAEIARPLNVLTGKNVPFEWHADAEQAFQDIKQKLIESPVLGYPDPRLPYILDTDASNDAMGAVLSQVQEGMEKPIAYFSRTFSSEEKNYCVTRKELLAVVTATKHFRPYLYGQQFKLRTDHASLRWMVNLKDPTGQVARWLERLQEFNFIIEHRQGRSHGNADGLSRRPCSCKVCLRQSNSDSDHCSDAMDSDDTEDMIAVQAIHPIRNILRLQQNEEPLCQIYRAVELSQPLTEGELQEGSPELKGWHRLFERLSLREDGILQLEIVKNHRNIHVVACPPSLRVPMIREIHEAAHIGEWRTYQKLSLNWYWPGQQGEVRRFVRACPTCQTQKTSKTANPRSKHHLYTGRPWQRIAIDFAGPLDKTARGNQYILVITDHFTRWSDAFPLRAATAENVVKVLDERVFSYFGVPEIIHSDQGSQFESQLMKEFCRLWGCDKTRTAPYRPQANGICERLNRTIADALRSLLLDKAYKPKDWDLLLPQIMRVLRAVPHTVTRETPNFLMFGREVRLPDALLNDIAEKDNVPVEEYAQIIQERMQRAHQMIREEQLQARTEDSEEPPLFKVGDMVYLKAHQPRRGQAKAKKLQPKFIGPYLVLQALPYHTYRVSRDGRQTIEHEARMKLHIPREVIEDPAFKRQDPKTPEASKEKRTNPEKRATPIALDSELLPKDTWLDDVQMPFPWRLHSPEPMLNREPPMTNLDPPPMLPADLIDEIDDSPVIDDPPIEIAPAEPEGVILPEDDMETAPWSHNPLTNIPTGITPAIPEPVGQSDFEIPDRAEPDPIGEHPISPRRSSRERSMPAWLNDYILQALQH